MPSNLRRTRNDLPLRRDGAAGDGQVDLRTAVPDHPAILPPHGGGNQSSQIRAVRRDIADGRRLWVAAGAWPWWAIARATESRELSGGPPAGWWELRMVGETPGPLRAERLTAPSP